MKQIIIVSSAEKESTKAVLDDFSEKLRINFMGKAEITVVHYSNLVYSLGDTASVIDLKSNKDILNADLVYFKSFIRYEEQAVACAHLLRQKNTKFFCSELLSTLSRTKLTEYVRLWVAGLPIPKTIYLDISNLADSYNMLRSELGKKFVVKAINGRIGQDNHLVISAYQLSQIQKSSNGLLQFVCQEFIANSYDLRILIANKKVKLIIKRQRLDDTTHLNNTSQGANAELLPVSALSEQDIDLSLRAAEVIRRELAGVDLMYEDGSNKPYIIEVNAGPQVGSGAFVKEKQQVFVDMFTDILNI